MLPKNILFPISIITLVLVSQNVLFGSSTKTSVYTSTPALTSYHHFYNGISHLQGAAKLFQERQEIDNKALDQMARCWEIAAKSYHAEAAYRLANLYELGMIPSSFKSTEICARNLKKALAYYHQAAELGHFQRFQSLENKINIHDAALDGIARIQEFLRKMRSQTLRSRVQRNFQQLTINSQAKRSQPALSSAPSTPLDSEPLKKETSEHIIAQLSKTNAEEKNTLSKQQQS